jgi:hypothetical protein
MLVLALLLAVAAAAPPAHSAPVTIGFDDLPAGSSANEAYAARGIHFGITPQGGAEGAVTVVATAQARSAPNAGAYAYDALNDFSRAWLRFDTPQSQVTLHTCASSGSGLNANAVAYDAAGNVIDNQMSIPCTAGGALAQVTLNGTANISYVGIGNTGAGWVIDDITFDGVPAAPAAPDFAVALGEGAPSAVAVAPGGSASIPLAVTRTGGSIGRIDLGVSGAPEGVTATIDPAQVGGTAPAFPTLRVTASADAAPVQRTLTITATPLDSTAGPAPRTLEIPLILQGRLAVRIEGMEVTQAVQTYDQPRSRRYNGVALVRGKKTVVRVFADLIGRRGRVARRTSGWRCSPAASAARHARAARCSRNGRREPPR